MKFFSLFFCTIVTIFILDMLWLGVVAKNIYAANIGALLRKSGDFMTPIWWAAIVVYICIALGVLLFVLPKANGVLTQALIWGALLGMITYGIYDFTNYSILANWPWKITLIDFAWGTVLCSVSSLIAAFVQNRLF